MTGKSKNYSNIKNNAFLGSLVQVVTCSGGVELGGRRRDKEEFLCWIKYEAVYSMSICTISHICIIMHSYHKQTDTDLWLSCFFYPSSSNTSFFFFNFISYSSFLAWVFGCICVKPFPPKNVEKRV